MQRDDPEFLRDEIVRHPTLGHQPGGGELGKGGGDEEGVVRDSDSSVYKLDSDYEPRFSAEEFGLVVSCRERDVAEIEALMRAHGALEVTLVAA